MRHKFIIAFVLTFILGGCDPVYHYVVFPPQRIVYTLVPSEQLMSSLNDSLYTLSSDNLTAIYDRKDFKVEVKYMTDYQLNTIEFPRESQAGEYSTNPFTYGNWVDPVLGYTPNRFTVFKVTIYNYAGSKINLDPENCFLTSDRGDFLYSYGREEKNSRYHSLENYFKKIKGTSGVDDDVFQSRMGIVRRTVHYLGKPVFRGDVREGLIVFDPLADEVEQAKLDLKNFIVGYDENNQPSEFINLTFFFKRVPFTPPSSRLGFVAGRTDSAGKGEIVSLDPSARPTGEIKLAVRTTNVLPADQLMKPLEDYLADATNFKFSFMKTNLLSSELKASNVLMILADEGQMKFSAEQERNVADFIRNGGIVIADERSTTMQSENWQAINNLLTNVGALLGNNVSTGRIPSNHPIYSIWKKFDALPPVDPDLQNVQGRITYDFLSGIFYENRLVAIISNRGYSIAWGAFNTPEIRAGKDFTRQRELLSNIFLYALESKKNKK